MKKQTEAEITRAIRALLKAFNIFHWKQLGTLGMPKGISDIIGIHRGRFLAIEVKRPGNKLSDRQARFLRSVSDAGGIALVAYSVDDVIDGLGLRKKVLF